jgi:pimeloyl-ACP methyl ester carboxylesterase
LLALRAADAADALVLVNPLPPVPWCDALPLRADADVVAWRQTARLSGTRRALPDSDDVTALFAFRHWRDESGRVLRDARAVAIEPPTVPLLCIASADDEDVPMATTEALATAWGGDYWRVPGGHVSPLLGRQAPALAARVAAWLSAA